MSAPGIYSLLAHYTGDPDMIPLQCDVVPEKDPDPTFYLGGDANPNFISILPPSDHFMYS